MLLPLSYAPKNQTGRRGFEPRFADSESAVLPLDDLPISNNQSRRWESNPHPAAYETAAASFELQRRIQERVMGLEPTIFSLEG